MRRTIRSLHMADARELKDFEGAWRVSRRITSADGSEARFEGNAIWAPQGNGLAYAETGQMILVGSPPMQAERRYFWAADLTVWFDDGRYFHQVPTQGGTADHWCDPDMYNGQYNFSDWPRFSVAWQVFGPRKDYRSLTEYRRS